MKAGRRVCTLLEMLVAQRIQIHICVQWAEINIKRTQDVAFYLRSTINVLCEYPTVSRQGVFALLRFN